MTAAKWGGRKAVRLTALTIATYGDVCHICHNAGANSADHILPRSLGGSDDIANLRPAHARCNSARGNRILKAKRAGKDLSGFFVTGDAPPADVEGPQLSVTEVQA